MTEMLKNFDYQSVQSTKNLIGNSFPGSTIFEKILQSDESISDICQSYFTFNINLTKQNDLIYNIINTNSGVCDNPFSVLFSTASLSINNVLIETIDIFPLMSNSEKFLNSNKTLELESGSPILPYNNDISCFYFLANGSIKDRELKTRQRNRIIITNDNNFNEITLNNQNLLSTTPGMTLQGSIPFPFLKGRNKDCFNNCKLTITFQSNPIFQKMFLIGNNINDINNDSYYFREFNWNIPIYQSRIPQNITKSLEYISSYQYRTNHTNSSYSVQIPSNSNKLLIYFSTSDISYRRITTNVLADGVQNFTLNYNNSSEGSFLSDEKLITQLYINFAGKNSPSLQYQFINQLGSTNNSDIMRAYQNYRQLSNSSILNEEALMTFAEFRSNPVFVFSINSSENSSISRSTLSIFTNQPQLTNPPLTPAGTASEGIFRHVYMNIIAYYNKRLDITYDNNGQVSEVVDMIS